MTQILNTYSGSDYSSTTPVILINPMGYAISDPTVRIVDTQNAIDFSSVRQILLIDPSGNSL